MKYGDIIHLGYDDTGYCSTPHGTESWKVEGVAMVVRAWKGNPGGPRPFAWGGKAIYLRPRAAFDGSPHPDYLQVGMLIDFIVGGESHWHEEDNK